MTDQPKFDRYSAFIVSGGRTGTKYFGDILGDVIDGADSTHEPDVLNPEIFDHLLRNLHTKVKQFGVYHLMIGKVLGQTGARNLSQRYLAKRIRLDQLISRLHRQRRRYYGQISEPYIIESNLGFYGLLPAITRLYTHYKIVIIIRDPRTWVPSIINWGTMYGYRDWVTTLGFGRLTPALIDDATYAESWSRMSRFQKVCWAWQAINSILLRDTENDPHTMVLRYEDLFLAPDRATHFKALLDFLVSFEDRTFSFTLDEDIIGKRIHGSVRQAFAPWKKWNAEQAGWLHRTCSPLMESLGYGTEAEWRALVGSA